MSLPRQVAAAVRTRLPLYGRGKIKIPRPPTRATMAAQREAHRRACEAHLALYPNLSCVTCHSAEAVSAFLLKATGDDALPLAVPLCFSCREDFARIDQRDRLLWFLRHGIDAHLLAQSLRYRTGELRLMELAIEAHTRTAMREKDTLRVALR